MILLWNPYVLTCNIFILQQFFLPWKIGPKARFSDYNICPFIPFFISQNTRNIYERSFLFLYQAKCKNVAVSCFSKKYLAHLQAGVAEENEQGRLESSLDIPCFLWPLTPVPPLALLHWHLYSFDTVLPCLACAFKCHFCCFAHLFSEDWERAFRFLLTQIVIARAVLLSACALRAELMHSRLPATWPEGWEYRGDRKHRATRVCLHPDTHGYCP